MSVKSGQMIKFVLFLPISPRLNLFSGGFMTAIAIKKTMLSDGDKTPEYEIPANLVKQKVQDLKSEQNKIENQIQEAKVGPVVRLQDENTQIFNLRQMQLVQKIKELEIKKQKTEKDINSLQTQKNSQLHNDLKKVAQVLMNETKSVTKITNLKEDMQELFEVSSMDRKNTLAFFENQTKDLGQMKKMIEECTVSMSAEYTKLAGEIQPLLAEKVAIEKELIPLRTEQSVKKAESVELQKELEELKSSVNGLHERISLLTETEENFTARVAGFEQQSREMATFESIKTRLLEEIKELQIKQTNLTESSARTQFSLEGLNEMLEQKRNSVLHLETEIFESVKRLNDYREQEVKMMESSQNYHATLSQLRTEIEQLSATRTAQMKLQEDAQQFLNEKRTFYSQELKSLEENHHKRMVNLEGAFKNKSCAFSMEFEAHQKTIKESSELTIAQYQTAQMEKLKDSQSKIVDDVMEVVKKHLSKAVFESEDVKADQARTEIAQFLGIYFTQVKSTGISKEFWKWSSLSSCLAMAGLCYYFLR